MRLLSMARCSAVALLTMGSFASGSGAVAAADPDGTREATGSCHALGVARPPYVLAVAAARSTPRHSAAKATIAFHNGVTAAQRHRLIISCTVGLTVL